MKFIQKITFDLGSLEYYRDELGWNVDSLEDVAERIKDWNDEELHALLGYATDYDYWIEETEV